MEREADDEDLDIPNIITLDMRLIMEKHNNGKRIPKRVPNKRHTRINPFEHIPSDHATPPHKSHTSKSTINAEIVTLEAGIAELTKLVDDKHARIKVLKHQLATFNKAKH